MRERVVASSLSLGLKEPRVFVSRELRASSLDKG
jgi:hypothetical protein